MSLHLRPRDRDDRGVSSVELVLYMPLLVLIIFIAVQFSLVWFGNQAASAVAREAARAARVYQNPAQAEARGRQYAATVGKGVLEDYRVDVAINGDLVRVTVTGHAQEISPLGVPQVSQTVEGPIEEFDADD